MFKNLIFLFNNETNNFWIATLSEYLKIIYIASLELKLCNLIFFRNLDQKVQFAKKKSIYNIKTFLVIRVSFHK